MNVTTPAAPPVALVTTQLRDAADAGGAILAASTGCGINLLTSDGRRITSAATDPTAERLNAFYDEYRENPCTAAWFNGQVIAADLSRPHTSLWAMRAAELGVRSILTTALRTADHLLGTVLVYSTGSAVYGPDDADTLQMFAQSTALRIDRCMLRGLTRS